MSNNYKYILFDLDGTITDSEEGITKSVQYALKYFNINVEDLSSLKKFIGPPLKDSFISFYNFDNNLKSIGVLFGFGDLKELKDAGADYIASSPEDIFKNNIINT